MYRPQRENNKSKFIEGLFVGMPLGVLLMVGIPLVIDIFNLDTSLHNWFFVVLFIVLAMLIVFMLRRDNSSHDRMSEKQQ